MILRLQSLFAGLLALLVSALLALAPASANPTSGGYQLFEQTALEHQHAIQLAALENFDYHAKTASECCNAPNRIQLIDDLVADGTRITLENVVDIRSVNGRTVWLETRDANAGLRHIVGEHGPEFAQRGISEAEIPDVLFTALQRNNVVGHQGRGTGRPIYEFDYGGQTHRLAITVGDNGFVVGANFR